MFYKCQYFGIAELVDKETFNKFGENSWMFFNTNILIALDEIRKYFNTPVTVNNWKSGGSFQWRGLRTLNCTEGGSYSQHKLGAAIDCDVKGKTAEEVRQVILKNKDHESFKHINCIEAETSWLHFDTRNISDRIRIVHP